MCLEREAPGLGFGICSNLLWDIAQATSGVGFGFGFFSRGDIKQPPLLALGEGQPEGCPAPRSRMGSARRRCLHPRHAAPAQGLRFVWGFTAGGFHQCVRLTEGLGNRKNKQEGVSPLQSSAVYR